jgi:protein-tyrosine phosphatase
VRAQIYWIDGPWAGRLGVFPRPRGGDWLDEEVQSWKQAGLDAVVSLLMPDEVAEFHLEQEAQTCRNHGIAFLSMGIPDRGVPASRDETFQLSTRIYGLLADGHSVGIHCRQGIGRSGLIAGCLLILAGTKPEKAVAELSRARGCQVPETAEQQTWLVDFATIDLPGFRQAIAQQHARADPARHEGTA